MRSPALALAWQVWRPHRWLWIATAVYLLTFAVVCNTLPVNPLMALLSIVSLVPVMIVAIGTFTLAPGANLAARDSGFPAWMFTLPVRTPVLAGWIMLHGTAAFAFVWTTVVYFIMRPCGYPVPAWWLVLFLPAVLVWFQALSWMPFQLPMLRVLLTVTIQTAILMIPVFQVLLTVFYDVPSTLMAGLFAVVIVLAYAVGINGVARARRGDGLEARWLPRQLGQFLDWLPRRRRDFASPAGAQLWYEWRRNGYVLPVMVGFILAVFGPIFLIIQAGDLQPPWLALLLPGFVLTLPAFMAQFMGASMGKADAWTKDPSFPSFLAARPMATMAFVGTKLRMTALSALVACLLGFLATLSWLLIRGNFEIWLRFWHEWVAVYPGHKAWTLLLLTPFFLLLLTWKNLVDGLWIGLTGRAWVAGILSAIGVALLLVFGSIGALAYHKPEYREYVWLALPWLAGFALLARLARALWVVRALNSRRMLKRRSLAYLVGLWFLTAGCLIGLAWWFLPTGLVSLLWVTVGCALLLPFTSIALMPLALNWNRHR